MTGWHGELRLDYQRRSVEREAPTVLRSSHHGPLRVLASLYPEQPSVCHNVLVHPPGGVVGGDVLDIRVDLGERAHALVTTPGATRFYRSDEAHATQSVHVHLRAGARLEWLPLESIAYSGTLATNKLQLSLDPGAEMMGWDVLALGLPAAGAPFLQGRFEQHIELSGVWLERGVLSGGDPRTVNLLASPLGWAGCSVYAMVWFASGSPLEQNRRQALLDVARDQGAQHSLQERTGVSSAHASVVVLRVLAHRVEPAMELLRAVRARWRELAWELPACAPRVWGT